MENPSQIWKHWWIYNVKEFFIHIYHEVTLEQPFYNYIYRTLNNRELGQDIQSYLLAILRDTRNKNLIPNILCPWGCSDYNHK